jgi:hypothetical protein
MYKLKFKSQENAHLFLSTNKSKYSVQHIMIKNYVDGEEGYTELVNNSMILITTKTSKRLFRLFTELKL